MKKMNSALLTSLTKSMILTTVLLITAQVTWASNRNSGAPDLSAQPEIVAAAPVNLGMYDGQTTCALELTANGGNIIASYQSGSAGLRYCNGGELFVLQKQSDGLYVGTGGARIIGVNSNQVMVTYRGRTELYTLVRRNY